MLALLPLADADGRAARGAVARDHPQELRLHALHRRARSRRSGTATPTGKPFYGPYEAQEICCEHEEELGVEMVPFRALVYVEDEDAYLTADDDPGGRAHARASRARTAPAAGRGPRDPELVHLSRGGAELRRHLSAAPPAGLHGLLHRTVRLGQVDDRQRAAGEVPGDGRSAGDAARRRHRAQEPVVRTRVLEGAPRHQHPPHRLRGHPRSPRTAASPSARRSRPTTRCGKEVRG